MNVVILAGGFGTRLAEETAVKPKPLVEVGGQPLLWHILKHYSHHGFKEFFVALGYKGEAIKRYFLDYERLSGDLCLDLGAGEVQTRNRKCEDWKVHLVDTGLHTQTGGRIKRLGPWLKNKSFMLTYGDGLCDVNLEELLRFHREHGRLVTVTAVRPPARFGGVVLNGSEVAKFTEKPRIGEGWINGGFFVCEPGVFAYLAGDDTSFEGQALERISADRQLVAFRHERFWQCVDTLRDLRLLEDLWQNGRAAWKVWG